jgi:hypothetical protein
MIGEIGREEKSSGYDFKQQFKVIDFVELL